MSSFGMILATHGGLAKGIISTLEMIMGPQTNILTASLQPGQGIQELRSEIIMKLEQLSDYQYVFIVTDLFGGTPSNSSVLVGQDQEKVRLLTGVNLPMVIQFCSSATKDPDQLCRELEEVGKEGVRIINNLNKNEEANSLLD
jgi:mannose PTS system EIIA component